MYAVGSMKTGQIKRRIQGFGEMACRAQDLVEGMEGFGVCEE